MNRNAPMKDSTGRYLTRALFVELSDKDMMDKYPPLCTIKEAHDLYMDISDPTEYRFAKALLEREETTFWDHWQRLLNTPLFFEYLIKWREELDAKLKADAVAAMKIQAHDSPAAAKWLAENGYKDKRKAGRPSKQEVENAKKDLVNMTKTLDEDAERIDLTKH